MKNLNFLRFATRLALLLTVVVSLGLNANAQVTVPDGFQYQAIARDASGVPMAQAEIAVRFTVDADNAAPVSEEFLNVMTNDYGLFNLVVGGTVDFDFEGLVNPTVEVEIDLGDGYISLGTVPFQSVPYAEVAGNVAYVDAGQLHVGDDVFNVGNFFTGTPGVVEPLEAVVVDANKSIEGFGDLSTDGTLSVGSTIEAQDYVRILSTANNTYGNWQSGALQVKGGAGIANDVWIGGDLVTGGSITALSLLVTDGISAGGDITGSGDLHITDIYAAGDAFIIGSLEVASIVTGPITATTIEADAVTADDFYGNFHGGTLDLGATKSVTVNDILTATADNDAALVTAGAVYDADMALETELMGYINTNIDDIQENAEAIEDNSEDIASNYLLIQTNSSAILANDVDIANNYALIQTNSAAILVNAQDIEDLEDFVMDDLDLQHAYDNGNVINTATGMPVDVIANNDIAIKGTNIGTFATREGQLGGVNAAVQGTDGTNYGYIAYRDPSTNATWAGYFDGDVNIVNDLSVENTGRIKSKATAITSDNGAFVVEGGVGIGDNLIVSNDIQSGGDLFLGGGLVVTLDTDLRGDVIIGTDDTNILTVNATSNFEANVNINGILDVESDLMVGGDLDVTGDTEIGGNLNVTGDLDVDEITATSVEADDFTGNFHGGTLDLGAAKSVTVNDIQTAVDTDSEALVTSLAVYNADMALETELMGYINTNANNIQTNSESIIANADDIYSNYLLIQTNSSAILQNEVWIESNYTLIETNSDAIQQNRQDIADHWAFVQDDLDLQHAYDNGNVINTAADMPVDVIAAAGVSVQGTNGDFVGQLAGDNAAVFATDGTNWAALAYAGVAKDGPYAGYFNGNVHITNDIVVENAARVQSESTADFSGNGALVVEGGVGIKDNLTVSNSIETHGEVIVGTDITVYMDTYLEHDATVGTDETDVLTVNATANFNAPVTIDNTLVVEDELTVNDNATINGMLTVSDVQVTGDLTVGGTTDVQEFTLDGDYGDEDELMISQGANENPIWTSVADLMENLTNGQGIAELDYDGSAPDVVSALVDLETVEFNGDDEIAVNEDWAFNWTNNHVFEQNVDVEGTLHVTTIQNIGLGEIDIIADLDIDGDVDIDGDIDVDGNGTVTGDLDVTKDFTASSVETNAVDTDDLTVNNEINFDGETLTNITNSAEVAAVGGYPLAGDDNVPTAGAITWAVDKAIEDRLDILYFQELYDNAVASTDPDNLHIDANWGPLQIRSTHANGGLDVFVDGATVESGIDARMSGGADDAYVVRGMLDEAYQGALGVKYAGSTIGVLGSDGNPTGVWGALAYDAGSKFGGPYAGYFHGNTYITEDQRVMGSVTIGTADGGGVLQVLDDTPVDATNGQGGSGFFNGGLGVNENLYVRKALIGRQSIEIGAESANYFYSDVNGTAIGNSTDLTADLDVWNETFFHNEITIEDELNLGAPVKGHNPGTASDLMISQGAGNAPVWTSVADLMYNLTNGQGIAELDYDGSAPDVVSALVDLETVEFNGDDEIAVNEDWAFDWTDNHTFALNVTVDGIVQTPAIENHAGDIVTIDDDLDVTGGLTVSDAVVFDDALTVGGTFHAQGAATMSSTLDVDGDATFGGTMDIDGNTTVGGTMDITSNTTVGGTFHAQGVVTMSDALTVDGATQINNNLTATGNVILGTDCANSLVVNAMADFNCLVTASALMVENDVEIGGNTTIDGTLHVDGAVTMSDALAVDGNLTVLGADITLGTSSAVTLLTVNASSVFNGPVDINGILEIDGLMLDGQLLTTVRTDAEGIRDYGLAEDTELVTEAVVASWLPDEKGAAQRERALVLDDSGVVDSDAITGSGFSMDLGTGQLDATTINGGGITASGAIQGQTLNITLGSVFGTGANFNAGNVNFAAAAAVTFNQNPNQSVETVTTSTLGSASTYSMYDVQPSAGATVTLPAPVAGRTITIINATGGVLTVNGASVPVSIPIGTAMVFAATSSAWYPAL